jgi:aspartate-semialdehyde dehydrogenase
LRKVNVAVLGASGAVGQELLDILLERDFPIASLRLLASARSAGKKVSFGDEEIVVEEVTPQSFAGVNVAFFCAGGRVSQIYAQHAVEAGAVVVDNTSAFRMDPDVPLVVPEVNPQAIHEHKGIIANPNCSTTIMVLPLKPLHDAAGLKRVVVSTYQAVSGAGVAGMTELEDQVKAYANGQPMEAKVLPFGGADKHYQIAFNLLPHIDAFLDNGYTKEEMKMIDETKKILDLPELAVTATTVRVPVLRSHSESVNVEFQRPITAEEAREILKDAPGIIVQDRPEAMEYPMPWDCSGKDPVYVGRIRVDDTVPSGLNMWVVGDQIRKGAALNAVQIAEYVVAHNLF